MALRSIEYRQLIQILVMFLIVQFGGLLLAEHLLSGASYAQVHSTQTISNGISVVYYVIYIAVVALVLTFLMKIYRGKKFFVMMEALVVFMTTFFVFVILLGTLFGNVQQIIYGNGPLVFFVASAILAALVVAAKNKYGQLKNAVAMISSIGFGIILGISFGFLVALFFMALLAVYDFIAVFITKHMITLANAAADQNLALMIDVNELEGVPRGDLTKTQRAEYKKARTEIQKKLPMTQTLEGQGLVPVAARVALGTGDLGIPLMVAISAYSVSLNFTPSFFIIFGALLGLLLTMLILRRYKRALPAIPPLLLGILLGVGAYFLIFSVL